MKRSALAALLAAIAFAAGLPARAQSPDEPSKVRVALKGGENNLTPFTVSLGSLPHTSDLLNLVYDTLFWSQAKRNPEPWLAEGAEPSPDRKTWTVRLRPGVKWHDGRPFTAEDVKFTFDYFKAHAGESGRYGHHVADVPRYERAQVSGADRVTLFFAAPAPSFRVLPAGDLPMLPKHIWEKIDRPLEATGITPVGTGPFRMEQMKPNERYLLEANSDYFKGKPLVEQLELSVSGDPNVAFNDLVGGKVDLVARTASPVIANQLVTNPDVKVVKATQLESVQLNFNARKAPLSDPRVRKAISMAIDNRVLVKTVLGGRGLPGVDSFIHPASPWAMPDGRHEFDVAKANATLDAGGYSRKDSDGIRKGPDGKRLEFAALFSTLEPQSLQALQLISQMTTAIGVRMEPQPVRPSQLRAVRRAPQGKVPAYDAYVSELESHTHTDPDALYFFFHSPATPSKGMGAQITGFSNSQFDSIAEDASRTVDPTERRQKINRLQETIAEQAPAVVLYYPEAVYGFRPAAYRGWIPDPGHGILTKRSFLEGYTSPNAIPGERAQLPPAWVFLGGVVGIVVLGTGLVLLRRRPEPGSEPGVEVRPRPTAESQSSADPGWPERSSPWGKPQPEPPAPQSDAPEQVPPLESVPAADAQQAATTSDYEELERELLELWFPEEPLGPVPDPGPAEAIWPPPMPFLGQAGPPPEGPPPALPEPAASSPPAGAPPGPLPSPALPPAGPPVVVSPLTGPLHPPASVTDQPEPGSHAPGATSPQDRGIRPALWPPPAAHEPSPEPAEPQTEPPVGAESGEDAETGFPQRPGSQNDSSENKDD